jgi:hypothetical protein
LEASSPSLFCCIILYDVGEAVAVADECVDAIYRMAIAESYCQRVVEGGDLDCVGEAFRELRTAYELAPDDRIVCFLVAHYARELSLAVDYSNRLFRFFLARLAPRSETLRWIMDSYWLEEEIQETAMGLDISPWEAAKLVLEDGGD